MKIDFNRIKKDSKNFENKSASSYMKTYPHFIKYFHDLKEIKKENLIIGAHFIYGWMPTILKQLELEKIDELLIILNRVKKEDLDIISEEELETLQSSINGSIVGVSKLLHFINPKKYAIWDSKVYKYIFPREKGSHSKINKPKLYIEYLIEIERISKHKEFESIYQKVEKYCEGYPVTPIRAVELIMFENSRQ